MLHLAGTCCGTCLTWAVCGQAIVPAQAAPSVAQLPANETLQEWLNCRNRILTGMPVLDIATYSQLDHMLCCGGARGDREQRTRKWVL